MDKYDIYEKADLAIEEAFLKTVGIIGGSIQLNQVLNMNNKYPPAFLINSCEINAQSICTITTHMKKGNLVLRVWSPFETSRINTNGVGINRKQDYHDFIYTDRESWDNNSESIARLIWNYCSLLMDWHMSYAEDMEGFDLDEEY